MATISAQEFLRAGKPSLVQSATITKEAAPKEPGFFSRVSEAAKQRGANVQAQAERLDQGAGSDLLQFFGQSAGLATDIIGEGLKSVGDATGITEGIVKPTGRFILNTDIGKAGLQAIEGGIESYNSFKKQNPEVAANIEAVLNIGALLPIEKVIGSTGKALIKGGEKSLEAIKPVIKPVSEAVGKVLETGKSFAGGVKDVSVLSAKGLSNIPARIATNVAEQKAIASSIASLPSKVARKAVTDGVDLADAKFLYQIPTVDKASLQKLVTAVQKFDSGTSKVNPIEVVGQPIVNRVKEAVKIQGGIGSELGAVAEKFTSKIPTRELEVSVVSQLKKVPGLQGIEVSKKGVLDFSKTSLASDLSKADRKEIQTAYTKSVQSGTGQSKHLYRQELFEILGGKKKSLANITATQEKALEAIRKGLSNILETKNGKYKILNQKYAEVTKTINNFKKLIKSLGGDEDLANLSAGLLARRLTSNASSNPQIRAALRALDKVTKAKGKKKLNTERLQDFYNILDRYYNISGKTSLQGQVQAGVEKASGVTDFLTQAAGKIIGKTDVVRKKALEDILKEVFSR